MPKTYIEDGYKLGQWVSVQRTRKPNLSEDQRHRLDELGFVWDPLSEQWEEGFSTLKKFKEREGHCRVAQSYVEDGYRLGVWVSTQRSKKSKLDEDRQRRLDELGFVWDPLTAQWEEGFSALKKFYAREGHCRVSRPHLEDGYRLGAWVGAQRTKKENLSEERRRRLDELGFAWKVG